MDAKNIAKIILTAPKEVEKALRDTLPRKAAVIAKNHFRQNFRDAGFHDGGLHPWKKTRRQEMGDKRTPLTSQRNHLMSSIDTIATPGQVIVVNPVPYAAIHNDGGTIHSHPTITPKMRKMAWAKVYALSGVKKGEKLPKELPKLAEKWRALALTKKEKLNITIDMPKRQFIGNSRELSQKLHKIITDTFIQINNKINNGITAE